MNPGENYIRYCNERDNTRIKEMEKKSTPEIRHTRKQLRGQRKGFADIVHIYCFVQKWWHIQKIWYAKCFIERCLISD